MSKRETRNLDRYAIYGQEKELTEAKAGRTSYSKKSSRASSRRRRRNEKASDARKRQSDIRRQAFNVKEELNEIAEREG